ncbi:hypothetical protein [Hyalangium rubrum]|uniref:Uncharacterized protein n=1 Tax=Hyalangium rubrum TaxID=3103134 RepID=A0ABU5HK06_9BACT|nr:hypothetical protein [Hyalangium sp. s54d21]MDY7232420.1 hypothetical protein [Hyalangium sp. s54d21]
MSVSQSVLPTQTEVFGKAVSAILAAMMAIQSRAERILAANGISPLREDTWYPLESVLQTFRDIQAQIGPNTVRAVGRKIPETAPFPAIHSMEEALRGLDVAYQMNHRGTSNIGGYHYTPTGERSGRVLCDNPYPCEFDEGLIDALTERYRPKDSFFIRVTHEPGACRQHDDTGCTYLVAW